MRLAIEIGAMRRRDSNGVGDRHQLLAEFVGQAFERTLFGLQDLGVVARQASFGMRSPLAMTRQN